MFKYLMKNLPSQFIFAGYSVRKSFTIMTKEVEGKIVYNAFLYTYVDNYLSFYLQMEDGSYKHVESGAQVPLIDAEELMSRHLIRSKVSDFEEYQQYDKEKIIGVFGVRDMSTLIKQVDEMKKNDGHYDVSLEAWLDVKPNYMGAEVIGVINTFNKCLNYDKDIITVPPIKFDAEDPFPSLIGDEMDYFDFMSNKDSDVIIQDLKKLSDSLDGVGNVKKNVEVIIKKSNDAEDTEEKKDQS